MNGAHLYLDIAKSDYLFHGYSGGMVYHHKICSERWDASMVRSLWKFAGASAALLLGHLWNFRAIGKL